MSRVVLCDCDHVGDERNNQNEGYILKLYSNDFAYKKSGAYLLRSIAGMKKGIGFIKAVFIGLIGGVGVYKGTKRKQQKAREQGRHVPHGPYEAFFKRPLDIMISGLAIVILSPVLLGTAVLVRVKLGKPVLFMQERPGLNEHIFTLYKFRTMTDQKDVNGALLPDEARLGSFGRKLRLISLDELPELINIIKGDMSIVGPRPLLVEYLPFYNDIEKCRHDIRPGLTGLAQTNGRNNLDWVGRFKLDTEYVNKVSLLMDLGIVIKTVKKVLSHDGVLENTSKGESNFAEERSAGRI